ncbi:MAG: HTH domain-containing protein [Candidatus Aenigmarchaeota archaeon]|nr:HTH domain-containing protein [Candidatus Aenigmarchaeota archaeon]
MPLDPLHAIEKIEKSLVETKRPVSISRLAKKTGLHYTTVRRYVTLLESVKKMPEIEIIKGEGITLVRTEKDFSKLSSTERKAVIKSYFPELSIEEKVLVRLLERDSTSESGAISIKKDKTIKSLLKAEIIKETKDDKVYLSGIGYKIAKGAKDIYGR